jgi:hypothetical protein
MPPDPGSLVWFLDLLVRTLYVLSKSNSSFNFERDVNFGVRWYNTVCLILLPVLWLDGVGQVQG